MHWRVRFIGFLMGTAMLATVLASSASLAQGGHWGFPDDPNLFYVDLTVISGRILATSFEFDWKDNPGASKQEVCTVYASNTVNLDSANLRQACGFDWGLPSNAFVSNYQYCMDHLSYEDAMLGPQEMAIEMFGCTRCINEHEDLIKAIQLAVKWDCFSSLAFQNAGISTNDLSYGAISSDPAVLQQCIQTWGGTASDTKARGFIQATAFCVGDKIAALPKFFTEIAPPWLGTLLDPQGDRAPPPRGGWLDQPCGSRRNPCYSPVRSAAIALATSNSNLRQSILWRFRNLRRVDAAIGTQAALRDFPPDPFPPVTTTVRDTVAPVTTPSPEIKKKGRMTGATLKDVNRRDVRPSVPSRTIPSAGLLETTPGLSPQGPAAGGSSGAPAGTLNRNRW
jgi:hypothetical protein